MKYIFGIIIGLAFSIGTYAYAEDVSLISTFQINTPKWGKEYVEKIYDAPTNTLCFVIVDGSSSGGNAISCIKNN